jgi:hypothetical protein
MVIITITGRRTELAGSQSKSCTRREAGGRERARDPIGRLPPRPWRQSLEPAWASLLFRGPGSCVPCGWGQAYGGPDQATDPRYFAPALLCKSAAAAACTHEHEHDTGTRPPTLVGFCLVRTHEGPGGRGRGRAQLRPRLLLRKFFKIFHIPRHIESLDTYMEY